MLSAALLELERHDWAALASDSGSAADVPAAVTGLLDADSADEAEGYYWELDNEVVVQGGLYESAVALVPVLCAALTGELSSHAKPWVLELLSQIVRGETRVEEIEQGRTNLEGQARHHARAAIWLFYRELLQGPPVTADEILDAVDEDRARYDYFVAKAAARLDKHR